MQSKDAFGILMNNHQDNDIDLSEVKYLREEKKENPSDSLTVYTYKFYYAPNVKTAQAFLMENPVSKSYFYIVVETPNGYYCRDKMGIYTL